MNAANRLGSLKQLDRISQAVLASLQLKEQMPNSSAQLKYEQIFISCLVLLVELVRPQSAGAHLTQVLILLQPKSQPLSGSPRSLIPEPNPEWKES